MAAALVGLPLISATVLANAHSTGSHSKTLRTAVGFIDGCLIRACFCFFFALLLPVAGAGVAFGCAIALALALALAGSLFFAPACADRPTRSSRGKRSPRCGYADHASRMTAMTANFLLTNEEN